MYNLGYFKNTLEIYRIVHRNFFDYLFIMTRSELINLIIDQENITKWTHKNLDNSTFRNLVLLEIDQEKKMKQHEDIMKQRKINEKLKKKKRLRHRKTNYN